VRPADGKGKSRSDPFEAAIESALAPGSFIPEDFTSHFVDQLDCVREDILRLVPTGEAPRAATLLEVFLAACHAKADEIDDSSGFFGNFAGGLALDWIRARQTAGVDPGEIVRAVHRWTEVDEYRFFNDLAVRSVEVLDAPALVALEATVRRAFEAAGPESYERRKETETLKAIHAHRRSVAAYAALCDETGGPDSKDCEALARICLANGDPAAALAWVDRGLAPSPIPDARRRTSLSETWGLPKLRREILAVLGRSRESLDAAWDEYHRHPSMHTYEELFRYAPDGDRPAWHAKALDALAGTDLHGVIEILTRTNEIGHLARLVAESDRSKLQGVSHTVLEPAAEALARPHPPETAKLRIALAMRIVEAKKADYYGEALAHLEVARDLLVELGREPEWRSLVAEIRAAHHRKRNFMPGLDRLASGRRSADQPSFLERARQRWEQRVGTPESP
jgi:hypothetical protein